MKKIAIIGKGTAGAQSVIHFLRHMSDCEIEWHYDPNISPQAVGEGAVLPLSKNLFQNLNFNYLELDKIDGTLKTGIFKSSWGKNKPDFLHSFPPPYASVHFNAVALQNYIFEKVKDKVTVKEHNVNAADIDADYVMDCSGKPSSYEEFNIPSYIPVNSVHVTQCYWEYPRFQHTLTVARPYGWVFGVPLQNRCSIGYLYNKDINTLEEVKEDVKEIFAKYRLTPSEDTNTFSFGNYYRKQNYSDRIVYNGNASFFLEPLEATSVGVMDYIQRGAWDLWNGYQTVEQANSKYLNNIKEIESVIMLHYLAGSAFDTEFWRFATDRANRCLESTAKDNNFVRMYYKSRFAPSGNLCPDDEEYGLWSTNAFHQNIHGLGIAEQLDSVMLRNFKFN
jgi:tryptophan halogenase